MLSKIIVVPRERIKPLIAEEPDKSKVCVISISTPYGDQLSFRDMLDDGVFTDEKIKEFDFHNQVFHLEFDDIDFNPHGFYKPMHFRDAASTWIFAKMWHETYRQDEPMTMYIHCDAGISRSAAIGISIASYWNIPIEHIRRPDPNRHIMTTMQMGLRYMEKGLSPKQQKEQDDNPSEEIKPLPTHA